VRVVKGRAIIEVDKPKRNRTRDQRVKA